jgi:hypothetical protein
VLAAVLCGGLSSKAISDAAYTSLSGLGLWFIASTVGVLQNYAAYRALVITATNRGTTTPNEVRQAEHVQKLFKETFGPFPTTAKTALYIFGVWVINEIYVMTWMYDKQVSADFECGDKAYDGKKI